MQPNTFNGLIQKGFCRLGIASGCQAKVHQLAVRINRALQVTPFATNPNIGFVDVPIQACTTEMLFRALSYFWSKFLHPPKHGRSIHIKTTLRQQVGDVLIR